MLKPKKNPTAVRIPDPLMERVDAYGDRANLSRHAAILDLIRLGLEREAKPLAKSAAKPTVKPISKPAAPTVQPVRQDTWRKWAAAPPKRGR